ncbi:hypothetical protein CYLTODRAFT_456403 [Cylindrobasidium torrendii FP15055 ss-10]|uniref:C2H2-type domain-containing protein n=1 Tax=Cylindrobasidium torrendii FP15055 ss-10 TaxID=1314674 RepID=A0A0D7B740_9AGAR|nr:hypothetical protein CYLTODRAFT_456403 [Cylindrobasidium torrendii FP15055 ss-10]
MKKESPMWKCSECDYARKRINDVLRHYNAKHQESAEKKKMMWVCLHDDCSFATLQKSNLENHIVKHTKSRPYICQGCKASFSDRGALTNHCTHSIDSDGEETNSSVKHFAAKFDKAAFIREHAEDFAKARPPVCETLGEDVLRSRVVEIPSTSVAKPAMPPRKKAKAIVPRASYPQSGIYQKWEASFNMEAVDADIKPCRSTRRKICDEMDDETDALRPHKRCKESQTLPRSRDLTNHAPLVIYHSESAVRLLPSPRKSYAVDELEAAEGLMLLAQGFGSNCMTNVPETARTASSDTVVGEFTSRSPSVENSDHQPVHYAKPGMYLMERSVEGVKLVPQ